MVMAGFLPFSAIYIELYYIFASIWGHKVYTIYSILFIVFLILIVVTAFITVALTYFQLAVEDHRWWWRSFLCGGSTAFFVLGYCFFYYHYRCGLASTGLVLHEACRQLNRAECLLEHCGASSGGRQQIGLDPQH
jgi:hypothetical protein